jgi:hypothetical protein
MYHFNGGYKSNCNFSNVNLVNNVTGLDEKDLNILNETNEKLNNKLLNIGFNLTDDGEYIIESQVTADSPKVSLVVVEEPDMGEDFYRVMYLINDENILSDTFKLGIDDDIEEALLVIKYVLLMSQRKISEDFFNSVEKYELYVNSHNELKNKLNATEVIAEDDEDDEERDINWAVTFDITINGEERSFEELTPEEQDIILYEIKQDSYSGTF